jgi:hypothetical protein
MYKKTNSTIRNKMIVDLFDFFSGNWSFIRVITQQLNNDDVIKGDLSFTELGHNRKLCSESGYWEGKNINSCKNYVFIFENNNIQIYSDNQLLHSLCFINDDNGHFAATHTHKCGNDHYKCTYKILSESLYQVEYEVKGPNKDYVMKTVYNMLNSF